MAALLEGDLEKFDRVILDLKECERLGIEVLPPDVNKSDYYFKTKTCRSCAPSSTLRRKPVFPRSTQIGRASCRERV